MPASAAKWVARVRDQNEMTRYQAVLQIPSGLPRDLLRRYLVRALSDPDSLVRMTAVRSLSDIAGASALRHMRSVVSRDRDDYVKASAIESIGVTGNARDLPLIVRYLRSRQRVTRVKAAYALFYGSANAVMETLAPELRYRKEPLAFVVGRDLVQLSLHYAREFAVKSARRAPANMLIETMEDLQAIDSSLAAFAKSLPGIRDEIRKAVSAAKKRQTRTPTKRSQKVRGRSKK